MEEDQKMRFICNLCSKKYPCEKSLGGHMKSHMVFANSAESDEKFEPKMKRVSSLCVSEHQISVNDSKNGEFGNGQSSYGLRDNPRKTWRSIDLNVNPSSPLQLEKICKKCGKGFQSLKALCGHMACHSGKDKGLKDDDSWTSDSQKLVINSPSDSEEEDEVEDRMIRTRSSKAKRCKKFDLNSNFVDNLAYNNGDSSVSEIDGDEQESVAMCLMLLSRDSGNYKGRVSSFVEFSDNNSVVLEPKSFSSGKREEALKEEKKVLDMKFKDGDFDVEIARVENSDSDYFLDECAKPESGLSVDGSRRNARFGEYNSKSYRSELKREFTKENEHDDNTSQKRSKYECFNCKRTFKSFQALGGHRPCHKRSKAYYESRYESGDDDSNDYKLVEHNSRSKKPIIEKKIKSKKSKGHVCPFCNRVFKNGQALGGHKRSHFIGGHVENRNQSPINKPDLLDLNLPAPEENEVDGHDPW